MRHTTIFKVENGIFAPYSQTIVTNIGRLRAELLKREKGIGEKRPERNLAGNAIDFFVQVLGLSFHEAMRQIYPVR